MSTPSEVFAGAVLDKVLKPDSLKFVDKVYDYEAHDRENQYVIEVKLNILPPHQMKALAEKYSKGVKALLLVVDSDENYCLFELTSTNLTSSPSQVVDSWVPNEIKVPKRLAYMLSREMNLPPEEAVRKAIDDFEVKINKMGEEMGTKYLKWLKTLLEFCKLHGRGRR